MNTELSKIAQTLCLLQYKLRLTFNKVSHSEKFLIMHQYKYNTVSVQGNLKRILSDTQIQSQKIKYHVNTCLTFSKLSFNQNKTENYMLKR